MVDLTAAAPSFETRATRLPSPLLLLLLHHLSNLTFGTSLKLPSASMRSSVASRSSACSS